MNKKDKLIELVNNNDLPSIQKNILNGFIERAYADEVKHIEDRVLCERISNESVSKVLYSTDEVKIYKINPSGKDDWSVKYPFRLIYLDQKFNKWFRASSISPTFDIAFLVYLKDKYLGVNSDFVFFATRMLGINMDED